MSRLLLPLGLVTILLVFAVNARAQLPGDTARFFLANKKGLLGRIGRSISYDGPVVEPKKIVNRFKKYSGKIIRNIELTPVGFNQNLNDTAEIKNTFSVHVAKTFHKNSTNYLIRRNLFFKEGDKVLPLLISDNERFLRDQTFLQDALIVMYNVTDTKDSVDVVILTRDVFSIGGSFDISSTSKAKIEIKEENLLGTGNRIAGGLLYDTKRGPKAGFAAEYINRNIKGSFINWTTGFTSYNTEILTGRNEETKYYTLLEKPLVSRYSAWTASLELSYNTTSDAYRDSLYHSDFKYSYTNADLWGGYNIGRNRTEKDSEKRLRHFVGMRTFYNRFYKVPSKYLYDYNYNYADINGLLFSYTLYRQNFYQTNFIYGFGRNEDIPEGITATATAGYTNKQGQRRGYYGLDFTATHFSKNHLFTSYVFRAGGFVNRNNIQDVDILFNVDHFTKLKRVSTFWRNRNFFSTSFTRQINTNLNTPLFLRSDFGLPYFRNALIAADVRTTIKLETVFYNLKKIAGFRIAPFIFTDFSCLKQVNDPWSKLNGYTAIGGGMRTRNENLIFGTIELRGYIFPRTTMDGMKNWKVEVSTNLQFKYNSTFIRRPDFVLVN